MKRKEHIKNRYESLNFEKVYISAMRNGYLEINKIVVEKGHIVRDTLKAILHGIDQAQCKEIHLFMNSMFSVWACEDITLFKNKPKLILHLPVNEAQDSLPTLTINRSFSLFDTADEIAVTDRMYDGLTDEMLLITYKGEHDRLSSLPAKAVVDIKEVVDNLYKSYFTQPVLPLKTYPGD